MNDISICPMTENDLDAVLSIEKESFPLPWTRGHFVAELNSSISFPMVAVDSRGCVAGYVCPMLIIDEGHILNLAVRPDCRGKGIGGLLVQKVLDECRMQDAEFVSLEVRTSNSTALALYRNFGFVETGRRKAYYENGEDAILMEYIFTP